MCGIAGWSNIRDKKIKLSLTSALGRGVDTRGGHGCGFVSIKDGQTHSVKTTGEWGKAPLDFVIEASESDTVLMHARFATCGTRKHPAEQAHPFAIRRNNKTVLYGAHNGVIWDAWESAAHHQREIDVDSQEIFELIADENWKILQILAGYGVAMWVEAGKDYVNLARLTPHNEMCIIEVEGGGFVWGSTWQIVSYALKNAKLRPARVHPCNEVGRVYQIGKNGIVPTKVRTVKVLQPFKG